MLTTAERQIVQAARNLIADEGAWTYLAGARNAEGKSCEWSDPAAVRFCAAAALLTSALKLLGSKEEAECVVNVLVATAFSSDDLILINDHDGHAAVMSAFDEALALPTNATSTAQ